MFPNMVRQCLFNAKDARGAKDANLLEWTKRANKNAFGPANPDIKNGRKSKQT